MQHGYRKPENPRKKPVKAGTGQGRFEIFRFQVSRTRPERGLERHGFSREFFSRPEDPKMPLYQPKRLLCMLIFSQKYFLIENSTTGFAIAITKTLQNFNLQMFI